MQDSICSRDDKVTSPVLCGAPIVVHFTYVMFAAEYLPLIYSNKYQLYLRGFKNKSKNVCWPAFLDHPVSIWVWFCLFDPEKMTMMQC